MKGKSKKIIFSIAGLSLVGLLYGHSVKDYRFVENITYQGYHINKGDGSIYEVFDPESLSKRAKDGRTAKYYLETEKIPSLKIGQKYDIVYGIPKINWIYSNRLLKAKKSKN